MIRNKGFTLIEILLVMTIIVIIASGSYVGFISFNRQQNLNIARDTLRNSLNEARSNAMSQVIATPGCKQASRTLVGHQVSFNTFGNPQYYLLQEVCISGGTIFTPTAKRINLPSGVVFVSPPPQVQFLIITGGVFPPATTTIRILSSEAGGQTRTVTVNATGVISSN